MKDIFSSDSALKIYSGGSFLVLLLMAATPIRSTVVVALLLIYSLVFLWKNKGQFTDVEQHRLYAWVIFGLAAYFIGRFAPFVMSGFSSRYISAGIHMLSVAPVFMVLWRIYRSSDQLSFRRSLEWGAVVGAFGAAIVAIYQTQVLGWHQADGFLFSINFGYVSGMLFAICLAFIRSPVISRVFFLVGLVSAVIAVVLSGARGAIFALPLLVVLWVIFNLGQLTWQRIVLVMVALPFATYVSYASIPMVKERTDRGVAEIVSVLQGDVHEIRGGESLIYRVQLWIAGYEAAKRSPLFGLTYPEREALNQELSEQGVVIEWVARVNRGHAHSQYFETLATGGLVGVAMLFVYLILPGFYYAVVRFKQSDNDFALAGGLFTASVMIFGLTEVLLQQEMIATVYAFIQALLLLMCHRFQSDKKA